jgi:hypothetical protein
LIKHKKCRKEYGINIRVFEFLYFFGNQRTYCNLNVGRRENEEREENIVFFSRGNTKGSVGQ